MFRFALAVLSLWWHPLESLENHAAQIKGCVPALQGRYPGTWSITGKQVKRVLGEPSRVLTFTMQSAGTWHSCWCDYEKLGIRVILYAENRLVWAVPTKEIPEDWEV